MTQINTTMPATGDNDRAAEFEKLKQNIHSKLVDKLDLTHVGEMEGDTLRREIRLVVEHLCDTEDTFLNRAEREKLVEEVLDETFGLGPLEALLKEPAISEIMINGPKNVYVENGGNLEKSSVTFRDDKHLMQIIDRIVSKVGRRVDEVCPMVDARLQDGSRVNAIIPPLALDGPERHDSPIWLEPAQARRFAQLQECDPRDGHAARRSDEGSPEHYHFWGYRFWKDDAAQYAFELYLER